uniref:ANK_REP_REGION domain-containing protein n=1 Tax=Macrostomum lignano TaxID=282301 RepID=A0A1I8FX11_9PLAT
PLASDDAGDTAAHLTSRRDHLRLLTLLPFNAKWLPNHSGATPLMEAARTGSWRCAKHLLHLLRQPIFNEFEKFGNSKRLQLLEMKDRRGQTAMDLARFNGHSELARDINREIRLVLKAGFISGLTFQEKSNRKALKRLADAGNSLGLQKAATRGSCDLPEKSGATGLMWAAFNSKCCDEELWQQLLRLSDPTCSNMWSRSCLHYAAQGGNSAAASALLAAGASPNARDRFGSTPLMVAAREAPAANAAAVCRVLLDAGSDWSLRDGWGRTALDSAREKGRSELVELLLRYEGKKFFDETTSELPPE